MTMEDLLNNTERSKYSLDELLEYQQELQMNSKADSSKILYNDSSAHALFVYIELLRKGIQDNIKEVKLFCGRFSMFRDKYKEIIESLIKSYEEESDNSEKLKDFKPYEVLMNTLEQYLIGSGGKLKLIVAHDIKDIEKENCWDKLRDFFNNGQIEASKLRYDLPLNHYMVVGDAYRRENSEDERTALCCFNDPNTSRLLSEHFNLLLSLSDKISFDNN